MLLGVVLLATGMKLTVAHAGDALQAGPAGPGGRRRPVHGRRRPRFRRRLRIGGSRRRLGAALLALATVPLGLGVTAAAQLAALLAVLAGALVLESVRDRARLPAPSAG